MKTCSGCGSKNIDTINYCPNCGNALPVAEMAPITKKGSSTWSIVLLCLVSIVLVVMVYYRYFASTDPGQSPSLMTLVKPASPYVGKYIYSDFSGESDLILNADGTASATGFFWGVQSFNWTQTGAGAIQFTNWTGKYNYQTAIVTDSAMEIHGDHEHSMVLRKQEKENK